MNSLIWAVVALAAIGAIVQVAIVVGIIMVSPPPYKVGNSPLYEPSDTLGNSPPGDAP